jgi:hypothetical protein
MLLLSVLLISSYFDQISMDCLNRKWYPIATELTNQTIFISHEETVLKIEDLYIKSQLPTSDTLRKKDMFIRHKFLLII